ncbi:hypothetical protein [Cohnella thailandensis]|uniref:Uncharacterized protein n=1 Tax=Cohnella thailandensis TaxID=557557 RepID=A0A841SLY8_9BACL|nr:hypothetical protein [Cohnella thailandensis]MBB6632934.1 hypothetical protein [Cohnella thailandensis]MBP1975373.1 hypothetical protein [Cohnella thailandensis]
MWWRPRQSELTIDRIAPLYPLYPFIEEDPLPQDREPSPHDAKRRASAVRPAPALPADIRQSFLDEETRRKYATYTPFRIKSYADPPLGILLDTLA